MALYVDGFLIPIPKKNLARYRRLAAQAGKVWRELGALEYRECVGDDLAIQGMIGFPRRAGTKPGETVLFSWITYRSRAHRDQVNTKVMKDPRIVKLMESMKEERGSPFEFRRMSYGGFKVLVDA
jgi:uncharacterized protein YbaA (DUF1428 family)